MIDIISVFKGANSPTPMAEVSWQSAIRNIQSGRFRPDIEAVRKVKDTSGDDAYRTAKKKLTAVTFCARFEKARNHKNVVSVTGFLIPDLDHLPDVDKVFSLLCQDENIWFAFRSPSGDGLKCALRADGIKEDADIKVFFSAAENYFRLAYNIRIDVACKDIARLTFVSHDPNLFKNPKPIIFDIKKWLPVDPEPKFFKPPDFGQSGWKEKYGLKVLATCCQKIKDAPSGQRHPQRLKNSRLIGGFIASGFIDESIALSYLEEALKSGGTKDIPFAMKTVRDGIEYGKKEPLQPEERVGSGKKDDIQYYTDVDEVFPSVSVQNNKNVVNVVNVVNDDNEVNDDGCGQVWSSCGQPVVSVKNDIADTAPYNLASEIKYWIDSSTGCFTCDQIDREFGLTSRRDKKNRATILARAIDLKLIKKTKIIGKYEIIDKSMNEMDIKNTDVDSFDVSLPFDLHRYCEVPKKGVVIIAGSKNSGKTALLLNILKANLGKPFKSFYMASEMGPNETKKRLLKFKDVGLDSWLGAKFIERSTDQGSIVETHNPDGLSLIDYLEEVEGEYFKITSQIRSIYDSLGTGVSVIGIQKHTESDYARGGQGTAEKARLYLTLDALGLVGDDSVSAIKVLNIKNWVRKNLQWHELHFKIKHGAEIEPLTDWMPCSTVNRKLCLAQYQTVAVAKNPEKKKEQMDEWTFEFMTETGELVGLNKRDLDGWKNAYTHINVDEELDEIANWSYREKKLSKKGWFMAVSGMLRKSNDKKSKQLKQQPIN